MAHDPTASALPASLQRPDAAERDSRLHAWLAARAERLGLDLSSLASASADASFRRYFRVDSAAGSLIVMDAPPGFEDPRPFVAVRDLFAATGVRVPRIHEADLDAGFLLLEDFGATQYLPVLGPDTAAALYADATRALIEFQRAPLDLDLPRYDRAILRRELELFRDWYCIRHLGATLDAKQNATIDAAFETIIAACVDQPTVLVHRDYHSRNLMIIGAPPLDSAADGPGILDFQDAVIGPVTYDLVSLLRDAYVSWEEAEIIDWAIRYWERARAAGIAVDADFSVFWRDFEWMGLQRHLKVLGIFARLAHRDGKTGYLDDLPRVLAYVHAVCVRYNGLGPLARLIETLNAHSMRHD
ncbi:phosphotransferase [soil metagenome]